jgi:GT2 family glycosyltransferase
MTRPGPKVATLVLNYQDPEDTLAAVASVQASECLDQRIIVLDNGPAGTPAHRRLESELGAVATVLATGSNLGFAAGMNRGLEVALTQRPEFVWLLNPDLRVEPATLARLLETAGRFPDGGAFGPRITHGGSEPTRIWFDGGIFEPERGGRTGHVNDGKIEADTPAGQPRDTGYLTGACLLLRATAIRQCGPLPEEYFLYFEETEYCRRLAHQGWRLIVDQSARAEHHKRSSGQLPTAAYTYYMRRNKELFARRMGLDVAAAVAGFEADWVRPWRRNVAERAPSWLPVFDELIDLARADGAGGRTGRRRDLPAYPAEPSAPTVGSDPGTEAVGSAVSAASATLARDSGSTRE